MSDEEWMGRVTAQLGNIEVGLGDQKKLLKDHLARCQQVTCAYHGRLTRTEADIDASKGAFKRLYVFVTGAIIVIGGAVAAAFMKK